MSTGLRTGMQNKLYRNTGTYGTPVWSEITIVVDVTLGLDKNKAMVKSRATTWEMCLAAMKKGPLEFGLLADTSNAAYDVLRDSYINDTVIDFAVCDQAIAATGAEYFRADYIVFGFPLEQPLEEADNVKVTCDLAYNPPVHTPAWVNVA